MKPIFRFAAISIVATALFFNCSCGNRIDRKALVTRHNYQVKHLPIYLPGNGGLLTAVAMMAAGWDGAPDVQAPGFPQDGNWTVHWQGLGKLP